MPYTRTTNYRAPPLGRIARTPRGYVLAFDPGEHIGFAVFQNIKLLESGEFHSLDHSERLWWLNRMFQTHHVPPPTIVCESYRIYRTHLFEHANSDIPTLRMIGAIELLCVQNGLPLVMQSAAQGKSFVTRPKLDDWGFIAQMRNPKSMHEQDAITHGLHYQIFGTAPSYQRRTRPEPRPIAKVNNPRLLG